MSKRRQHEWAPKSDNFKHKVNKTLQWVETHSINVFHNTTKKRQRNPLVTI
jgi:hypothetical protein